jgi:Mpv17 / PMP22 family
MRALANWYVDMLKRRPLAANVVSAVVLMTIGDGMAQEIELHHHHHHHHHAKKEVVVPLRNRLDAKLDPPKLNFRRYGTLSPNRDEIQLRATKRPKTVDTFWDRAWDELRSVDYFRSTTMIFWAGAVTTPFFLSLFRLFDRYLPFGTTPVAVVSRVGLTFMSSIPVNAVFFCYGCLVHHITGWIALVQERHCDLRARAPSMNESTFWNSILEVPFDLEMLQSTAQLKLDTELLITVKTSAMVWIPFNTFNFSVMPPHLRPVAQMLWSVFWNCYLSLAQHRDASL